MDQGEFGVGGEGSMVMSNLWREWVRGGGGRHDSMAGRWVMEMLLIVALDHDIYREGTRSYVSPRTYGTPEVEIPLESTW